MVQTCDAGSLPFSGDFNKFSRGVKVASLTMLLHPAKYSSDREYFEDMVKESLLDKVRAGIDVPSYPQFRDMNEMFLESIRGIEKTREGYVVRGVPSLRRERLQIPEVAVLKEKSREISEEVGETLRIRVCVTGPYTLSSLFSNRGSELFTLLGDVVSKVVEENIFTNKHVEVVLVSVDEPVFGLLDEPLLDYGSEGMEGLLRVWEHVFRTIKSKKVQSCIHLHNTSNELFWQAEHLDMVESHVCDPLYAPPRTLNLLEERDKVLKASIAITDFDTLIRKSVRNGGNVNEAALNQQVADAWTALHKGELNPVGFLEGVETMTARLKKIIKQFGVDRVPFAGPECGLRSFPTYSSAIECLKRTAIAVRGTKV